MERSIDGEHGNIVLKVRYIRGATAIVSFAAKAGVSLDMRYPTNLTHAFSFVRQHLPGAYGVIGLESSYTMTSS